MSTYEIINLVISLFALCISLVIAIKDIVIAHKNKLTYKTLTIDFSNVRNIGGYDQDWIVGTLSITNHTHKEFTISRIQAFSNGKNCDVYQKSKLQTNPFFDNVDKILAIRLLPFEIYTIEFYIVSERICQPITATLSLLTPFRKIDYQIILPKRESKNNHDKTE